MSDRDREIDILLEIASMEGDQEIELSDVEAFYVHHQIHPGEFAVYNWQIYWHYAQWSNNPLPKHTFIIHFNQKFKVKEKCYYDRYFGRYYYMLNSRFEVPYHVRQENKVKNKRQKEKSAERQREKRKRRNDVSTSKPD